jgi:outer membrane protein assembly factor BamA
MHGWLIKERETSMGPTPVQKPSDPDMARRQNGQRGERRIVCLAALFILTGCFWHASAQPAPSPSKHDSHRAAPGPVYHLLGFSLSGTKRVDTAALIATLPQHEGDVITPAEIKDDADRIRAVLAARHVHGDMTTATFERDGKGHHIWVVWDVHLVDPLSYAPMHGKRHFASQSFSGNVRLTTASLTAATGLHDGDVMPDGSVGDARTGIEQAYDAALPGAAVSVKGKVKLRPDNSVVIDWQITEPK